MCFLQARTEGISKREVNRRATQINEDRKNTMGVMRLYLSRKKKIEIVYMVDRIQALISPIYF